MLHICIQLQSILHMITNSMFSFVDFLGKELEDYIAKLPVPVYVERMGDRSGLIRARLRGKL